jgi:hypothetical protein
MSAATIAAPSAFSVRVPPSWIEFDIWRATRTGDLARMVDTRVAEQPQLRRWRGAFIGALRRAAADAERQGALMCAAMLDPVEDAGMLAAVLTVFHTEGSKDPADNTIEAIAAQLTAVAPPEGSSAWRRVEIVEIPAGRAVRMTGVEPIVLGGQPLECVVMHTLIPVPDGGFLDVVLTSPQLQLAEPMLDLFDAISSTLTWAAPSPGDTTQEGK